MKPTRLLDILICALLGVVSSIEGWMIAKIIEHDKFLVNHEVRITQGEAHDHAMPATFPPIEYQRMMDTKIDDLKKALYENREIMLRIEQKNKP
jgi:uncharacterized protein YfbU (UPF0304 family)